MIPLRTLVKLQAVFALLSVTYLLISLWRKEAIGEPLSAAALGPSLALFGLYAASLFLAKLPRKLWYRIAMVFALLFFGGGGVIGNIYRFFDSGLEQYASFPAWLIAVLINGFGSFWNVIAAFGLYKKSQ